MSEGPHNWERETLEQIARETLQERRRARRWNIFFRSAWLVIILILLVSSGWFGKADGRASTEPHTALIDLNGEIAADGPASADQIDSALQNAFQDKNTKGVVLRINSPGGSPVQAGEIYDEIRYLRGKYPAIPLYVVAGDICASGGYYIAAAADRIYVDKASIIGSVGVRMDGFGFTGLMKKVGVERRLITAGAHKGYLDPFEPVNPVEEASARAMLEEVHQQFIRAVRLGRGKRLKETPDMFSGLVWSGAQSIQLGLADGYGTLEQVARDVIKAEEVVDYTPHEGIAQRLAHRFGADVGSYLAAALEAAASIHLH